MVSVVGNAVITCQDGKPIALAKRMDVTRETWDAFAISHEHFTEEIAAILILTAAQEFGAKLERRHVAVQVHHWEFGTDDKTEGESGE